MILNQEVQNLAKEAAETVVLVIDEDGVEFLISELLKGVSDNQVLCIQWQISVICFESFDCCVYFSVFFNIVCWVFSQAAIRRSSSYLIGYFFKNSKLYLVDEAPNLISTLIVLLSDSDSATVVVCLVFISLVSLTFFMLWTYVYSLLFDRLLGKPYQGLSVLSRRRYFLLILNSCVMLYLHQEIKSEGKERSCWNYVIWGSFWYFKQFNICYFFYIIIVSFNGCAGRSYSNTWVMSP